MASSPPLYPHVDKSMFQSQNFNQNMEYPSAPELNSGIPPSHYPYPSNPSYPVAPNNNPSYPPSYTSGNTSYPYQNQNIGFNPTNPYQNISQNVAPLSSPPPHYWENQAPAASVGGTLPYGIHPPVYQASPMVPPTGEPPRTPYPGGPPVTQYSTRDAFQTNYPGGAPMPTPYPSAAPFQTPYSGEAPPPTQYPAVLDRRTSLQSSPVVYRKASLGFTDPASNNKISQSAGNSPRHSIAGWSIDNPRPPSAISENSDEERTPLPANLISLWESPSLIQLYFVQEENHVVAARKPVQLIAYKCPVFSPVGTYIPGSMSGCLEGSTVLLLQKNTWRLGLRKNKTKIIKGKYGELAVLDDSTNPERTAVLSFPKQIAPESRQRLDVLLKGSSSFYEEPTNVVEKAEDGVDFVYSTITKGVNNLFKDTTPGVHKNTKFIRKGAGSLLRMSGSLVSKGIHLVADQIVDKEVPTEFSPEHKKLLEALDKYREALGTNKITRV